MVPTVTDCDEWKYLNTLEDSDLVGFPYSVDQGYSACILQQKYPDAPISLTATTLQVLRSGISAAPVPLTLKQHARHSSCLMPAIPMSPQPSGYSDSRIGPTSLPSL